MHINNNGDTRLVFVFDKYVVKVPRMFSKPNNKFYGKVISFLNGWTANRNEYIWHKSNLYGYLCPIKYSFLFSLIIIMPKAEPLSEYIYKNIRKRKFGGYEHKQDSYGLLNNKIVIVDYGN